jgi:hypothetical protein
MARDHLKKASSSSKDESDKDESLSTRKSETELLSPSDKCAIRITPLIPIVGKIKAEEVATKISRFIRFAKIIVGESWYRREYWARRDLAREKDVEVRKFYKALEKDAFTFLKACFPSEHRAMLTEIKNTFGQSKHKEINEIRKKYEEKVTAPIKESIQSFSFHETMNDANMEDLEMVRLRCFISLFIYFTLSLSFSLSRRASLSQQKCEERRLLRRICNLVENSVKKRKLIKELETNTKAVRAEASRIMEEKDKRIAELEAVIREYEETLSNKDKHIAELKEQLEAKTEKMPGIDNVSLIRMLTI